MVLTSVRAAAAQVVAAVQRAGYVTAVTTMPSIDHSLGSPMPTTTISILDIETADVPIPPLARPTSPIPR